MKNTNSNTVGQFFVYPGYGVVKQIPSSKEGYLCYETMRTKMKLLLPESKVKEIGVRELVTHQEASLVEKIMQNPNLNFKGSNWNRRFREIKDLVQSGDLSKIAQSYAMLKNLKLTKDLSFGEKKMFQNCFELIKDEFSVIKYLIEEEKEVAQAA